SNGHNRPLMVAIASCRTERTLRRSAWARSSSACLALRASAYLAMAAFNSALEAFASIAFCSASCSGLGSWLKNPPRRLPPLSSAVPPFPPPPPPPPRRRPIPPIPPRKDAIRASDTFWISGSSAFHSVSSLTSSRSRRSVIMRSRNWAGSKLPRPGRSWAFAWAPTHKTVATLATPNHIFSFFIPVSCWSLFYLVYNVQSRRCASLRASPPLMHLLCQERNPSKSACGSTQLRSYCSKWAATLCIFCAEIWPGQKLQAPTSKLQKNSKNQTRSDSVIGVFGFSSSFGFVLLKLHPKWLRF